ncbi:2-hydroxyethylphosphonate methyltransferase [bacterium HR19]|nr:2-hydroxyethylphosphonate methyltransferase [bacterium HR19]
MKIFFLNPLPDLKLSLGPYRFLWNPAPPIWASYLSAIARKYTDQIYILDNCVEKLSFRKVVERIKWYNPDFLCISVLTQTANFSFKVSKSIRELLPNTKIVMGGPHATYFAEEIVRRGLADFVVCGEGEETFEEILSSGFPKKGAVFKVDGEVFKTPPRERIKDIDNLPFPAWEFFTRYFRAYRAFPPNKRNFTLTFLASRGCPFSCNFCMVQLGRKYIIRSPENICDEIEYFYDKFGCRHFWFVDPLFPPSKKLGLKIMEVMIKRGISKKVSWDCETRADMIDDELAEAMKEAGCELVALGIEGGDEKILENINKKMKLDQIISAVSSLKKYNIKVMGLYMLGTPGETEELTRKTIKFARKLDTSGAKFSITVPYPGTELYEKYIKGKYQFKDEDWDRFSSYSVDYPYKMEWTDIPPKKLLYFQRLANFYVNFSLKKAIRLILDRGIFFFLDLFKSIFYSVVAEVENFFSDLSEEKNQS